MKSYWVYILASRNRVIYIGVTGDLEGRLRAHREKIHPDSFTARYNCTRLVLAEEYSRVADALAREKS